ncbi:MAG: hypothetical protein U0168_04565 [Nannocystaceae bacterium]
MALQQRQVGRRAGPGVRGATAKRIEGVRDARIGQALDDPRGRHPAQAQQRLAGVQTCVGVLVARERVEGLHVGTVGEQALERVASVRGRARVGVAQRRRRPRSAQLAQPRALPRGRAHIVDALR